MRIIRILLAEDEKRMSDALAKLLRLEGYETDCVYDGNDAAAAIMDGIYDVVILDVMMPGSNGFEVTKKVRKSGCKTPILMLTSMSGSGDIVTGLDSGADDYLTKPFMTNELLARLRALTRRNTGYKDDSLRYGDIVLDPASAVLACEANGNSVRLGDKEYRIMEFMILNSGHILSREQLAVRIWGYENEAEYNKVEVYMSFTRKKLAFIESKTEIKAVRGMGYELRYRDVQ